MKILSIDKCDDKDFPLKVTIVYHNKHWDFGAKDIEHIKKKIMERVYYATQSDIEMDLELNYKEFLS